MFDDYNVFGDEPEREWQDHMQVCPNGHVTNDRCLESPKDSKDFCDKCGKKTITECPNCKQPIPGVLHRPVVVIAYLLPAPDYCENCGAAFPWIHYEKTLGNAKNEEKPIEALQQMFSKFHAIAVRLRNRHNNRPTLDVSNEYDVQDLLSALLVLQFDDIRPEEWTPSYAGKSARMDFLLKNVKIVVEAKMTRQGLSDKEIGDQLIVDIARYKVHPDCDTLVCFIYDPDSRIINAQGLIQDLQDLSRDDLKVIVFIYPSH